MRRLAYILTGALAIGACAEDQFKVTGRIVSDHQWNAPRFGEIYNILFEGKDGRKIYAMIGEKKELDDVNKKHNPGDCIDVRDANAFSISGDIVITPDDIRHSNKCGDQNKIQKGTTRAAF